VLSRTQLSALILWMGFDMSEWSPDWIHVAHVRHDEGRGLRLQSMVGSGRTGEKQRKEMRRARCPRSP